MDISNVFDKVTPLSIRPTTVGRGTSPFRALYLDTLDLLAREFRAAKAVKGTRVLEMDLEGNRIRLDGFPFANARPATSYVAVRFRTQGGREVFLDCGQYGDWTDNLRAIALTLEALRKPERYGVARGRQYAGFLPPSAGAALNFSEDEAARVLIELANLDGVEFSGPSRAVLQSPDVFKAARRRAQKAVHPNGPHGDPANWEKLSAALRVLDSVHESRTHLTQGG